MTAAAKVGTLRLCGLGTHPPTEATIETLAGLGSCRVVFADLRRHPSLEWLCGRLSGVRPAASAEAVVSEARRGGKVGLAVWGHALYTSRLAGEARALCRRRGVEVELLASASPPGSVIAREFVFVGGVHRAVRFGVLGVDGWELAALLADPRKADAGLALAVYSEGAPRSAWGKLSAALSPRYPAGHTAHLRAETEEMARPVALSGLAAEAPGQGAVLYIPPVGGVPYRDEMAAGRP